MLSPKRILIIILLLFTLQGLIYSVVVPPFEASDEKWHYPMVKYIADHWALPVQVPGVETDWRQEGSQPPLYYFLGAVATFWIDTSDLPVIRRLNPYADAGATPDGNVNLVVHNPALERFPWRGTVLALHIVRLLSVLMGTAAVYLTYCIAREIFPKCPGLALGATAIHAFTPMFVFISASVNNDNLTVLLCNLGLLLILKAQKPNPQSPILDLGLLGLGFVLGLGALTKASALGLIPLAALALLIRDWRQYARMPLHRRLSLFTVHCSLFILPVLAVSGWWYIRNLRLYGDLTGLNVFIEVLGKREIPADLAQLWRERFSFLAGYWGNFGGLNVPMPAWVYTTLNWAVVVAFLGLGVGIVRTLIAYRVARIARRTPAPSRPRFPAPPLPLPPSPHPLVSPAPLLLCLLWGLAVLIPWAQWARITWSSQGRLVFPAIAVWSLLLALGLDGWAPRRLFIVHGGIVHWPLAVFLLVLTVLAPWLWIRPAYALPKPLTDAQVAAIPNRLDVDFGETLRLLGYNVETGLPSASGGAGGVEPGGQVAVTLYWQALAPTDRDYTVFVHLLGEGDRLVAQRDTYPGLGLLSTTWLEPEFRWADRYVLRVPETAFAPDSVQIEVGIYDGVTGERLPVSQGGDNVRFGRIEVRPRPGVLPNPIAINFGNRMTLIGYDLDRRIVRPGDTLTLTLVWRADRRMDINYTVSAQLIDPAQRKAAQLDSWPQGGAAPTTAWQPGQTIADVRPLAIAPDALPGVYDVRIVVYHVLQDKIVHLPVISRAGEMLASHVVLTRVRVVP